jgi:hypothetical protein
VILLKRAGHRESLQTAFNLPDWESYEKRNNKVPVLLSKEPSSVYVSALSQQLTMVLFQWLALLIGIVLLAIAFLIFAISQSFILTVVIYFASAIFLDFIYVRNLHTEPFSHIKAPCPNITGR